MRDFRGLRTEDFGLKKNNKPNKEQTMHTASREWCDRVAARNAIEVAKAQRVWQPGLFSCENRAVALSSGGDGDEKRKED